MLVAAAAAHGCQDCISDFRIAFSIAAHTADPASVHFDQIAEPFPVSGERDNKPQNKYHQGGNAGNIDVALRIWENVSEKAFRIAGIQD